MEFYYEWFAHENVMEIGVKAIIITEIEFIKK